MLFLIVITTFIILNLYFIFNLYLTNDDSSLQLTKNMLELKINLSKFNPVLINIPTHPVDLEIFNNLDSFYKNNNQFDNLLLNRINFNNNLLNSNLLCNFKYSLSNYKDKNIIQFKECKNNYHIISCITGKDFYIYLLHPKYKNININDKETLLTKSERVLIKPFDILIIPFGWKYLQEINEKTINYHIDVDNYFTIIHNYIINNI